MMPVAMAGRKYPFPFRTRKSSSPAPMILRERESRWPPAFFFVNSMESFKLFDFTKLHSDLFSYSDSEFKLFQCRLIPGLDLNSVIGVRFPLLRQTAKKIQEYGNTDDFFDSLPHKYFEENVLHGYLIERIKDAEICVQRIDQFIPFIDNWAVCDTLKPSALKRKPDLLLKKIMEWISVDKTYYKRFAIRMLMCFFLDENFKPSYLKIVADIKSDDYYINMMISWFFATALAKQWDSTFMYIQGRKLSAWCHKKTIQKAIESYRISDDKKIILKNLSINNAPQPSSAAFCTE